MDHNSLSLSFVDGDPRKPRLLGPCQECATTPCLGLFCALVYTLLVVASSIVAFASYSGQHDPRLAVESCSFAGVWQQDVGACECFACAQGERCEERLPADNCTVAAAHAQFYLFEELWNNCTVAAGYPAGWRLADNYRVPFQDPVVLAPSGSGGGALDELLLAAVRRAHAVHGNANTSGRYVVYAASATELLSAAYYGLAMQADAALLPLSVVERQPSDAWQHFSTLGTDSPLLNPAIVRAAAADEAVDPLRCIEVLTYPSTPAGDVDYAPVLGRPFAALYDLSYNWPHTTAAPRRYDEDVMVFSLAHATGHGGSQFAWALLRDGQLAHAMRAYILRSSGGTAAVVRQHALAVLTDFVDQTRCRFVERAAAIVQARWDRLLRLLSPAGQDRFAVASAPHGPFLLLRCSWPADASNCSQLFADAHVAVLPSADTVRLTVPLWSHAFESLVQKLTFLLANSTVG